MMSGGYREERIPLDSQQSLRIVVADDDARMREFYAEVLSHLGHEVVGVAADGLELVDACLERKADLVVTDIKMPGMDGIEAARVISQNVDLPFLFVSAYHDELFEHDATESLVYRYLVKPIKQEDLEKMIPAAMRQFWGH